MPVVCKNLADTGQYRLLWPFRRRCQFQQNQFTAVAKIQGQVGERSADIDADVNV